VFHVKHWGNKMKKSNIFDKQEKIFYAGYDYEFERSKFYLVKDVIAALAGKEDMYIHFVDAEDGALGVYEKRLDTDEELKERLERKIEFYEDEIVRLNKSKIVRIDRLNAAISKVENGYYFQSTQGWTKKYSNESIPDLKLCIEQEEKEHQVNIENINSKIYEIKQFLKNMGD